MILDKLRNIIKNSDFDAILLAGDENEIAAHNLYYVTKYTGSYGFAFIGKDFQYFVSDFRYREQAKKEVPNFKFVEAPIGKDPDQRNYVVSNDKIEKFGFKAKYSVESGIVELIKGYKAIRTSPYRNI